MHSERICTYRKGKQRKAEEIKNGEDYNGRKLGRGFIRMHSAVLDYGDYTIAVWDHCYKGSIAEVYELVETPDETGLGRCECRISLIERKEEFEDAGHAMAWALGRVR